MLKVYSKIYEYMFITFNKHWPDDIPEWNASLIYTLMILFILILISLMVPLLYYINMVADARIVGLLIGVGFQVLNYFLFIRNGRFKEFRDNFYGLDKNLQRKKYITGLLITLGGYVIPITAFIFVMVVFH
jgi:hypothetical protein